MERVFIGCLLAVALTAGCASDGTGGSTVDARSEAICWWNCNYTETEHPIVLLHGFMGFDSLLGGIVQYWPGIPDEIEDDGGEVYITTSSTANSSEVRGEIIIDQLEELQAITGEAKFNLIGHSQGSLDARYIAAVRPDLVASVTSVGGPHKGSDIAGLAESGLLATIGQAAVGLLANLIATLGGVDGDIDAEAALDQFTPSGIGAFNAAYPQAVPTSSCGEGSSSVNGIRYYSWSGTGLYTNVLDPFDPLWPITSLFFSEANDGLVGRCSSHLGDVIKDNYFQNHLDEVNLIFGLVSPFTTNPKTLFRNQANRLKNAGL